MRNCCYFAGLLVILMCCAGPLWAQERAQEGPGVIVLPFETYARDDLDYLRNELQQALKRQLGDDGARVLDIPEGDAAALAADAASAEALRSAGRTYGADYIVLGSITWIDEQFSLDANLINTYESGLPQQFFVAGKGVEQIPDATRQIATSLGDKIFKREKVAQVLIAGNERIEADAIRNQVLIKPGDTFSAKQLSEDLKRIYAMGYFDDIRIESEDVTGGKQITFTVTEKPTIRKIEFSGNSIFDDEELREELDIRTGSILNIFAVQRNTKRLEEMYREKNYHNVTIDYELSDIENNQGDLTFKIEEGSKVLITDIVFEGNSAFDSETLEDLMKTSEKDFFWWISSSGDLNMEDLDQDVLRIKGFYQNNGFIEVRVSDPEVAFLDESIRVTLKIYEGPRFEVGRVSVSGDLIETEAQMIKQLRITEEPFFNREAVRNDVLMFKDLYSDQGYAYAEIEPDVAVNKEDRVVDIDFQIDKGKPVYFEKIIIEGNTRTRDKVIRRELNVYEQELFSGLRLKRGVRNLYRLGYFEDVKVDTVPGSADDQMILKVTVEERSTGNLSIGGGYSSVEEWFGTGSIAEENFLGLGQELQFKAEVSDRTIRFNLSYTEPWLFDMPLSGGIDLYSWERDYDTYDKYSIGGGFRLSYPIAIDTRLGLKYNYDVSEVDEVTDEAPESIKELVGKYSTSAVGAWLSYNSTDRAFNPTRGQDHSLTVEYAGLGGDISFIKAIGDLGLYFPIYKSVVGFIHGEGGYVQEQGDSILPDYERFYLGGINSMRGFDWHAIHAVDENGNDVGGDKFVLANFEINFPLFAEAGIWGVLFYDTGDVYGPEENIDLGTLRQSAGYGVRWYSPVGPIRLERGHILDPEEGEDSSGSWEFSMGAAF
jgi:outer membrane protein insertion porin family